MRTLRFLALMVAIGCLAASSGQAQELRLPQNGVAGQAMTVGTTGSGEGTLYLVGPGQVLKRQVQFGSDVQIKAGELQSAGRWLAILRASSNSRSQAFWVRPGPPENLSFLARPSRVPVARPGVISGIAVVFDGFQNLVLSPTAVKFSLSMDGAGAGVSETVASRDGVAWVNSSSARKAGPAQFVATAGDTSVRRVVQQVASDPCNLRMHVVERNKNGVIVETDPVRDCTSNPVPDGTIVTFTQTDSRGRSTVDARIKKGIARAVLPSADNAVITVASGVVLGNELHVGDSR
ncbi:MAG TPA: hypothetical protein VI488_01095 [Candidatus Angelobacter sp.]